MAVEELKDDWSIFKPPEQERKEPAMLAGGVLNGDLNCMFSGPECIQFFGGGSRMQAWTWPVPSRDTCPAWHQ